MHENYYGNEAAAWDDSVYPVSPDEIHRQSYLSSLLLTATPDQEIDEIAQVVAGLFRVPMCFVSIVDEHRQWFKANVGLPGVDGTSRAQSFCAHTLLPQDSPEVLFVPDAMTDPRFKKNPLVVGHPGIRFYCGSPIIVEGVRLGGLCVIDTVPMTPKGVVIQIIQNTALLDFLFSE